MRAARKPPWKLSIDRDGDDLPRSRGTIIAPASRQSSNTEVRFTSTVSVPVDRGAGRVPGPRGGAVSGHEDVEAAESLDGLVEAAPELVPVRQVRDDGMPPTRPAVSSTVRGTSERRHASACVRERLGDRTAETAASAGDERPSAREVEERGVIARECTRPSRRRARARRPLGRQLAELDARKRRRASVEHLVQRDHTVTRRNGERDRPPDRPTSLRSP